MTVTTSTGDSSDANAGIAAFRAGSLAVRLRHYTLAVSILEECLERTPDHAPTLYLLGAACFGTGDFERARHLAERTLSFAPRNAAAMLLNLRSLASLHRWDALKIAVERDADVLSASEEFGLLRILVDARAGGEEARDRRIRDIPVPVQRRFPDLMRLLRETEGEAGEEANGRRQADGVPEMRVKPLDARVDAYNR